MHHLYLKRNELTGVMNNFLGFKYYFAAIILLLIDFIPSMTFLHLEKSWWLLFHNHDGSIKRVILYFTKKKKKINKNPNLPRCSPVTAPTCVCLGLSDLKIVMLVNLYLSLHCPIVLSYVLVAVGSERSPDITIISRDLLPGVVFHISASALKASLFQFLPAG